jgi:hypothetical protein
VLLVLFRSLIISLEGIFNESVKSSNRGIIAAKYNIRFLSLLVALNPLMVKNQLVIKSLMVMYSLIRLTIEISRHFLLVKKRLFSSLIIFFEFLGVTKKTLHAEDI